jgi:hypothetical protein
VRAGALRRGCARAFHCGGLRPHCGAHVSAAGDQRSWSQQRDRGDSACPVNADAKRNSDARRDADGQPKRNGHGNASGYV